MSPRFDVLSQEQRDTLRMVFQNIPSPRSFTVVGKDGGDIRNPKNPEFKWAGKWSDPDKISSLLTLDEAISLLDRTASAHSIALCFYPNCGHAAIDLDSVGQDYSDSSPAQKEVFDLLNHFPTEVSKSGKGAHIFFLANTETFKDNGHIELFGNWGYVCLTGDFLNQNTALSSVNTEVIDCLKNIIKPPKENVSPRFSNQLKIVSHNNPENVLALLHNCDPNVPYDRWMNICFAFQACYGGDDGQEQFDVFSQGGTSYDPVAVEKLWFSFDPSQSHYSIGTLIYEAKNYKGLPNSTQIISTPITYTLNDAGNAKRFASQMKGNYLYIPELKSWLVWRDDYWQFDFDRSVMISAMDVAKSIYKEASQVDPEIAKKVAQWANSSSQKNHLDAMVELAKSFLSKSVHLLDSNPMVLGVRNGVVDLTTGSFRKAHPADLITQQCDVVFDPNAAAPTWEKFVLEVSNNDPLLVTYKQEYWGYVLTGETSEQCFFYYHGCGRNGKSTEINLMHNLMGSYAKSVPSSILMVKNAYGNQGPTPEIARLSGARLVTANETEDGARLAEAQIKAMTGQDVLTARVLHGEPFDFKPKFKLFISGNHKPVVRGEDDGIWRRIKVIPFNTQIPETSIDPDLFKKLLAEKSGILNWMIAGCLAWQKNRKLTEPPLIKAEVIQYRNDQDIMGAWLAERCTFDQTKQCATRDLYMDYSNWVKEAGSAPVSETRFATRLTERGLIKARVSQKMTFHGITLNQRIPIGMQGMQSKAVF